MSSGPVEVGGLQQLSPFQLKDLLIRSARDLMAANLRSGRPLGRNRFFRILTEEGETVAEVSFAEAIPDDEASS